MTSSKTTSHQTIIPAYVPGAPSVVAVPLLPGVVCPGVSAVAVETPLVPVSTDLVKPALSSMVDKFIDNILLLVPLYSTTVTAFTASPGVFPSITTAVSSISVSSGNCPSALTGHCPIIYKRPKPIENRTYHHSDPPDDAADSDIVVPQPTIHILGCKNSTSLLLKPTSRLPDLITCKLHHLMSINVRLPLVKINMVALSLTLWP